MRCSFARPLVEADRVMTGEGGTDRRCGAPPRRARHRGEAGWRPSRWAACCAVVLGLFAAPAAAQAPAERVVQLIREGADLGRAGDYAAAIARFKEAERLSPAYPQDCNVGHAYLLWNRLPQAWLFLERCAARPGAPAQFAAELDEVTRVLAEGAYAPVEVAVTPPGAVLVVVSLSFDEPWQIADRRQLWLPFGQHTLELSAPGRVTRRETLDVIDREARRLAVTLDAVATAPPPPPQPRPEAPPLAVKEAPAGGARRWALAPAALGVVALGAGAGLLIRAAVNRDALRGDPEVGRAFMLAREGEWVQTAGLVACAASAALLATAALIYLLGRPADLDAAALWLPGGAAVMAAVRLP